MAYPPKSILWRHSLTCNRKVDGRQDRHLLVELLESINSKLDEMGSDFDRLENTVMRALKILEEKMDQLREGGGRDW